VTHYALESTYLNEVDPGTMKRWAQVSEEWHGVLGLIPNTPPSLPIHVRNQIANQLLQNRLNQLENASSKVSSAMQSSLQVQKDLSATVESRMEEFGQRLVEHLKEVVTDVMAHHMAGFERRLAESHQSLSLSTLPIQPSDSISPSRVTEALSKLYGLGASARSKEQYDVLVQALSGTRSSICVLGTGVGKSVAWLLVASETPPASDTFSIVVTPFVALMQNHILSARKHNIMAIEWKGHSQMVVDHGVRLLFVAVENIGTASFRQ
jgi:hypothetical protein